MIPPHVVHLFLTGPRHVPGVLAAWAAVATRLRLQGHSVRTPVDVAREASATWDSLDYVRAATPEIMHADGVVLTPGWDDCPTATTAQAIAEAYGVPCYEFDPDADLFLPVEEAVA